VAERVRRRGVGGVIGGGNDVDDGRGLEKLGFEVVAP